MSLLVDENVVYAYAYNDLKTMQSTAQHTVQGLWLLTSVSTNVTVQSFIVCSVTDNGEEMWATVIVMNLVWR